ncbi:MAG: DUF1284 domain-containing protein [Alkaliphilus sp.]
MNTQKQKTIKIRGHHLLCMHSFKGFGYSQTFKDNMYKVISAIKNSNDLFLHIVAECDDICSYCPHSTSINNSSPEICLKDVSSEIELREMDMNVVSRFKLSVGDNIKASEIFEVVQTEIKKDKDIFKICGSCKWIDICVNGHK